MMADKCKIKGDVLELCDGFERMIRGNGDAIGMNINRRVNIITDEITAYFVTYKMTASRKSKSFIFDYCPNCGEKVRPDRFTEPKKGNHHE